MASLSARIAAFIVRRRVKPALGDMRDPLRVRAVFGKPLAAPRGVQYRSDTQGGVPGEWVSPADGRALHGTLLYLHGGGFVGCSARTHRPLTAALALQGWRVFVPDYRLAPEHPFPAAPMDVIDAWTVLEQAHQAARDGRLVVGGDSAGGNLALALMVHLRDGGRRLPDAAALFSPAVDLTGGSDSLLANAQRDAMFDGACLGALSEAYLRGADAGQPLASPLLAPLHGLPPLIIHAGVDEALRDDSTRLAQKAREAGVRVQLQLWPVVPHVWQLLHQLPEARRSVQQAAAFLRSAQPLSAAEPETLDVLIVGAGLSGIGAAAFLQDRCPDQQIALLEARERLGGTWDLFRYPGVRSDSDMYTLGYAFKPWTEAQAIADGPSILRYIGQTATERGLDRLVRLQHRVLRADWSSAQGLWTVQVARGPQAEPVTMRCRVLHLCSGYYSYAHGHTPEFAGRADFQGTVVHPQFWPEGLSHAGQRVVVIGSGATAVTLVPEMARSAAHVTMLQRSPSYVVTLPARDAQAEWLKARLPAMVAYRLVRLKNIGLGLLRFWLARRWPDAAKAKLVDLARQQLGPGGDASAFSPRYKPWDQRVCAVPDGDLFQAVREGRAEVVTDQIVQFTPGGIRLASGRELAADIVVTATGLQLNVVGDIAVAVDGQPVDFGRTLAYKGMMFSGVPNLLNTFGYTNASWTLKADLTAAWLCRLVQHLQRHRLASATPRADGVVQPQPFVDFSSGYVQRAVDKLPKQGDRKPWRLYQNYLLDLLTLRYGRLDDGVLHFAPSRQGATPPP